MRARPATPPPRDVATPRDAAAPVGDGSLESLRQACVDTINMYRATKSLPPRARAPAANESCSDEGAKLDSTTGKAHGSAAKGSVPCRTAAVAQNACPNYPVRAGSTAEATMKGCLTQMWAEGEPPGGVASCTGACFQAHGHYINMIANYKTVSCGFFENDKKPWWMNQDFSGR